MTPTDELIELDAAKKLVLDRVAVLDREDIDLRCALGYTLAEDIRSSEMVPGFDNSAMDGFAVRASDTSAASAASGVRLRTVDESRAGSPAARVLAAGEAIAISTGAALPHGADAIVRLEDTQRFGAELEVRAAVAVGQHVRSAGDDIRADELVLRAGTTIGASELGVLASVGRALVPCVRRPSVRVLTTGDELLDPHELLRPGAVRNANAYTVPALARLACAVVRGVETVGDQPAATERALEAALECDVAIACGGVSVGPHDHVRRALDRAGVDQHFWRVALRPGKPTWFGTYAREPGRRETLVFGLPGNPVSAIVTFVLFARPALRALAGADPAGGRLTAILDEDYRKEPGRAEAVRCALEVRDDGWHARPTGPQGSHVLTSMLGADGLGILPTASAGAAAGEPIDVELLPRLA